MSLHIASVSREFQLIFFFFRLDEHHAPKEVQAQLVLTAAENIGRVVVDERVAQFLENILVDFIVWQLIIDLIITDD